MTVKQLIKDIIAAYDPTLDLTDSSALTDLMINPSSAMMDPFIAQIKFLMNNLGMNNPSTITRDELDAIAANFLMSRNQGAKASGYVELLYLSPVSLTIPIGTTFSSKSGVSFVTVRQIYVPMETMQSNSWNYPYYSSGSIPVIATVVGAVGSIKPGDISTVTGVDPTPAKVTNTGEFSGGTDIENNTDFVARILEEVISGSLGSAQSIKTTLMKNFTTIQSITVRGMGDPEMLRDVVASGISLFDLQNRIDFYGKVSGLNELPYPESRAYSTVYYDDPLTSGIQPDLPELVAFTTEFNNTQYAGMYRLNDSNLTTVKNLEILNEPFENTPLDAKWVLSDSRSGEGLLVGPDEFALESRVGKTKMRIGRYVTDSQVDNMSVTTTAKFLYNVLNLLKHATEMPPGAAAHIPTVTTYTDVKNINIITEVS